MASTANSTCRAVSFWLAFAALPALQVWERLYHIDMKIVLQSGKAGPVAHNPFGAQAAVLCHRHEYQVHMGCFLAHRHDIFPAYPLDKKISRPRGRKTMAYSYRTEVRTCHKSGQPARQEAITRYTGLPGYGRMRTKQ